ncbi:HAD family hydrolase [Neptunitalea lumnitzerae]|uniref:Haloacid dehalogenase n=1 Tax=Neptunitalea lumnitzerae TaxID=2965509 RepID=A0ABQ5ML60_9FLAO|nr:HAD family hydrolase [Neptunitalea sp. Y10]GLB50129.1 haloacid dehalogenase [Neptunitalea sp. Y10]
MFNNIKVIGFDADDTLWVNETYFRDTEKVFAELLSGYETLNKIDQELFKKEIDNLEIYGYGIKGFVLSMVESAIELSNGNVSAQVIEKILNLGKEMLSKPVELLDGVEDVLKALHGKYKLIVLTKGDLLDQKRKLEKSNLSDYFHHIEVMTEKSEKDYQEVLKHLDIKADEFLMVGNSLKSDVLPLLKLGSNAVHVPFHITWAHETVSENTVAKTNIVTLTSLKELLNHIKI